jgi:Zn finger protein HypA/HybF involved in hydrogenase expression
MERVASFHRSLDQELVALMRRASLECLVCGEFVLVSRGTISCPECGFRLRRGDGQVEETGLQFGVQAG